MKKLTFLQRLRALFTGRVPGPIDFALHPYAVKLRISCVPSEGQELWATGWFDVDPVNTDRLVNLTNIQFPTTTRGGAVKHICIWFTSVPISAKLDQGVNLRASDTLAFQAGSLKLDVRQALTERA